MLLSIDPGVSACGVAIWEKDKLILAKLISAQGSDRAKSLTQQINELVYDVCESRLVDLAIEFPQIYHAYAKGDRNDLLELAATIGALTYGLRMPVTRYLPREWKGQVPKKIMCDRIKKKLLPIEMTHVQLPVKSLQHNVWDGIGIGLKHLGRL